MYSVRRARPDDADTLVRHTLGNAWDSEQIRLDEGTVRRGVAALLADAAKGRVFVAEADGRIAGTCYVTFEWSEWHAAWYWWIQSVYVPPDLRGQGAYSALYRAVHEAARAAGDVRSIRLYVDAHNEHGLRAYRGHGMKETEYRIFEAMVGP